ncbi:MAG: hypothetical protein ACI8PZ_000093 [Myxococcota bacterium]|jgi:hypothetical protein
MRCAVVAVLVLCPLTAFAVPAIDTDGTCPGPALFDLSDLSPDGSIVALLSPFGAGAALIPAGPCAGSMTGLASVAKGPVFGADRFGLRRLTPTLGPGACGQSVQFLDVETCELTRVVSLSALAGPGPADCQGGSLPLSVSPGGDMVVCDDPDDGTCEQDFGTLCPEGWGLCSRDQFHARNAGWAFDGGTAHLGAIHCRGAGGGSGAGHYTVSGNLEVDAEFNCHWGSSRDTCETDYGCNELLGMALCCAPTPTCGNGVVDAPEELCDDGNFDETDDCLNNCWWKNPADHGFGC